MHSYKHYKDRAVELFEKYGWTAIFIWYGFFFLSLVLFATVISSGLYGSGEAGWEVWGAAYVLTKVIQPLRLILTITVTVFLVED
jgi:hypothetical protein